MNYKDIEFALLLNSIPSIGPVRYGALLQYFGSPKSVFLAPLEELMKVDGISKPAAENLLRSSERHDWVAEEMELARAHQIEILTLDHPAYPVLLKTMADPPPVLYCKGNLQLLNTHSIALVGSRHCTPYGEKVSALFASGLAELGITTISGLARGIDTHVHQATIRAKGATIAVLGSGLLWIYPRENRKLAEVIYKEGLIISEFPLNEPPHAGHFPRRNRIVAGLALGTVVVEASVKSGALITARYAAEQGREVFAVPGSITSEVSSGPNRLIKEGAKPIQKVEDILEEIAPFREKFTDLIYKEESKTKSEPLNKSESAVLNALCSDPIHIDRLHQQLKFSTGAFSKVLLDLELKGMIKPLPGKMYVRI